MNGLLGIKSNQGQTFLENGKRIPVTKVNVPSNVIVQIKTQEKDGYMACQLGIGTKKHPNKPLLGHTKSANTKTTPYFIREVNVSDEDAEKKVGDQIMAADILEAGDIVDVSGVSKGKGFAGAVKRHNFKGGPRTHGQSDRERAPGSIGQTTTPGRVYRGKRMAGHMGHENVTMKNLQVIKVTDDYILVKGLVPGHVNSYVVITKRGTNKKFVPVYAEKVETVDETPAQETPATTQETPTQQTETPVEEPTVAETAAVETKDTEEKPETEKVEPQEEPQPEETTNEPATETSTEQSDEQKEEEK